MKDFSLQLYSLRDIPTLRERLQIAADSGYTGVEFCGYEDIPADEMKSLLASLGLRPTGSHISQEALQADLHGCIAYAKQLGITSVTCPWIVMQTAEDAVKAAAFLEDCAVQFKAAGIPFAYHNHHHEFTMADGKYLLEILMENAPTLGFELDVFWASYAGVDPIAFIRKHAGRFLLLHFKEINPQRENVELGKGVLDFKEIARVGLEQGVQELIVEQEAYTLPPAESVKVDADYMKAL